MPCPSVLPQSDIQVSALLSTVTDMLHKTSSLTEKLQERSEEISFFADIRQLSKYLCDVSGESVDARNLHMSLIEESRGQVTDNIVIPPLVGRDPADRRGIKLTTGQKLYLIEQGPFQPTMESFHKNTTISKGKQKSFSSKWYTDFPLIE